MEDVAGVEGHELVVLGGMLSEGRFGARAVEESLVGIAAPGSVAGHEQGDDLLINQTEKQLGLLAIESRLWTYLELSLSM